MIRCAGNNDAKNIMSLFHFLPGCEEGFFLWANVSDLETVKKYYEEETDDKWVYEPDDLDEIYSIFGFDVSTDLLCYLMIMDTYLKTKSIDETYHKVLEMKSCDDFDSVYELENHGYTFMNDGFKHVNELRKQLKKEGV